MDIKENKTPKPPKKPTMIFYGIILLVLVAMNFALSGREKCEGNQL